MKKIIMTLFTCFAICLSVLNVSAATPTLKNSCPFDLELVLFGQSRIDLRWSYNYDFNPDGYYIYRTVGNGTEKKIETMSAGTTYTADFNVNSGNKYSYRISAFQIQSDGTIIESEKSSCKTIFYLSSPKSTIVKSRSNYTLKWEKKPYASGFFIEINGKLKKYVASNAAGSYAIPTSSLVNGYSYSVSLIPYKDGYYDYKLGEDGGTYFTYIKAPTITSLTNPSAGKVTVKWKENSVAYNFNIRYKKTTDSSYKTITTTNKTSKQITGLRKGKKYVFQVRANEYWYDDIDDSYYLGERSCWSASKSITLTR